MLRRLARPLLAAVFIASGVKTLRNPGPQVKTAQPFVDKVTNRFGDSLPDELPTDPETLVKVDAAVKVVAGLGLALGRFPRLCAFVLALNMVPTTLAGHAFWEHEDPSLRNMHQTHFLKNLGLLGGLLFAAGSANKPKADDA